MRKNTLFNYIDRFKYDRRKKRMLGSVLSFLGIIVTIMVYWQLKGTGFSMTKETEYDFEEDTDIIDLMEDETADLNTEVSIDKEADADAEVDTDVDADMEEVSTDTEAEADTEMDTDDDTESVAGNDTDTTTLEYTGDDYMVTVTYGKDAEIPEGTSLWVYEYLQESGTYLARYAEAAELYGWDTDDDDGEDSENSEESEASDNSAAGEDNENSEDNEDSVDSSDSDQGDGTDDADATDDEDSDDTADIRLFNISLVDESGNELEPAAAVQVVITYLNQETESDSYTIIHFGEDETETIEAEIEYENGTQIITFELESFSEVMTVDNSPGGTNPGGSIDPGGSGGDGPGGGSGNNDPPSSSTADVIYVWYDRVTVGDDDSLTSTYDDDEGIDSVTLDGEEVPYGDSSDDSYQTATNGLEIDDPYDDEDRTVTIVVTPESGYYITFICIGCCTAGAATDCDSYDKGEAYESSFTISDTGAITIEVPLYASQGFYHGSGTSSGYFIMIAVASTPSPLYIEYDYGEIVNYIDGNTGTKASSAFSTSIGWTETYTGNNYGDGVNDTNADNEYNNIGYGVMTDDTQYKYSYASDSTEKATNWAHYANSITTEAKEQAAAAGYVFAGWYAEYYTTVTVSEASDEDYDEDGYQDAYNNWVYTYSGENAVATYGEGDAVTLTTHVRLTAQWIPIGVTVEKIVSGLSETDYADQTLTYEFEIRKAETDDNGNITSWTAYKTVSLDVTIDSTSDTSSESTVIYPLPTGIYQIVETVTNDELSSNDNTTIYYVNVSTSGTVEVSSYDYSSYTSSTTVTTVDENTGESTTTTVLLLDDSLTVTNTYTHEPVEVEVILKKVDENKNTLSGAVFTLTDSSGDSEDLDATNNDGTTTIGTLTVGSSYTLTEKTAPDGYSLLYDSISFTVTSDSTLKIDVGTNDSTVASYSVDDDDGTIIITVVNTTSPVMPSTGGEGEGRFHRFGMSLLLFAFLGLCGYKNISEKKALLTDGADESIYRPPRKGRSPDKRKQEAILRGMPKRGEARAGPDG